MAWDPNVPNRVYLGDDGGMYRSDANGDSGWVHGTNMPWLQEYHVAVSQTRPNRVAIGLQDNGSNRSWTNINDAVADPVAANWASYGGGDGHYVVIDSTDDTYYYSCSQNAGCSGVHDVALDDDDAVRGGRRGRDEREVASVTGLVVGNTITIDSTGANPETVTMTTVGTSGRGGTGVSFTPALAFAHASGATVVKNGVAGTQSLGFGSRGSGLRCTTDAPLVQDPSNSATLYIGCNNLSRSTNRGATWTQIAAPDLLTGPAPADDSADEQPALRGPVPVGLDDRAVQVRPEHDLRRHRQRAALADDRPRRHVAGVPEPVRARPGAVGDVGDRRPDRRRPRVRVVRRLPRGVHLGERLRGTTDKHGVMTWKNVSGNLPNAPVNFLAYDQPERRAVRGHRPRCLLLGQGQASGRSSGTTCRTRRPRI